MYNSWGLRTMVALDNSKKTRKKSLQPKSVGRKRCTPPMTWAVRAQFSLANSAGARAERPSHPPRASRNWSPGFVIAMAHLLPSSGRSPLHLSGSSHNRAQTFLPLETVALFAAPGTYRRCHVAVCDAADARAFQGSFVAGLAGSLARLQQGMLHHETRVYP